MSDDETDPDVTALLADLTRTLRELQDEVEPDRGPRLPTPSELSRFTSEVAIPGLILLLKTNVRTLQLLRRALRMADGRDPTPNSGVSEVRNQAQRVGEASLTQLEGVLDDLQSALQARPPDDEARELLSRARDLHEEVASELDVEQAGPESDAVGEDDGVETTPDSTDPVSIDVESELQTLKDNLDDDGTEPEDGGDDAGEPDGDDGGEPDRDGPTDHGNSDGEDSGPDDRSAGGDTGS